MSDYATNIARNVRIARLSLGITQEELVKRCGLSRATVSNVESGDANAQVSSLDAIARALSVPLMLLFYGKDYPHLVKAWQHGRNITSPDKIDPDASDEIDSMMWSGSDRRMKLSLEMLRTALQKVDCAEDRFIAMGSIIAFYEGAYFAVRTMLGLKKGGLP